MSNISEIVEKLFNNTNYKDLHHSPKHGETMPSVENTKKIIDVLREIFFPGYFGNSTINSENLSFYLGVNLDKTKHLLINQIKRGLCFECSVNRDFNCNNCLETAESLTNKFIESLPSIKNALLTDVIASYNGDPAAKSYGEIIYCYPCIKALTNYRVAHELYKLNIPLIPRIITELAHSETGIDIHPGAKIGNYFTIDHGTGVVIGETAIIGNNVKIYQGVTLGAKSFPVDENGNPIKGIERHPIVEDNVVIYSGTTILGRITIGRDSVIGGNLWITDNVPQNSKVTKK